MTSVHATPAQVAAARLRIKRGHNVTPAVHAIANARRQS